jgi:hypothetical protein
VHERREPSSDSAGVSQYVLIHSDLPWHDLIFLVEKEIDGIPTDEL